MVDSAAKRLTALRNRAGLSMDALAKKMRYQAASGIQRYESSEFDEKPLPMDFAIRLVAPLMGEGTPPITVNEVLTLGDFEGLLERAHAIMPNTPSLGDPQNMTPTVLEVAPRTLPKDVPVMGVAVGIAADGDDGEFFMDGGIVDTIRRPPGLSATRDVFALYVSGDSMEPRYEPGDAIFINPHLPVRPGVDVIVELHGADNAPGACYVKRLVRRGGGKVLLKQYNPAKEIEIPEERVARILRILTPAELLGI